MIRDFPNWGRICSISQHFFLLLRLYFLCFCDKLLWKFYHGFSYCYALIVPLENIFSIFLKLNYSCYNKRTFYYFYWNFYFFCYFLSFSLFGIILTWSDAGLNTSKYSCIIMPVKIHIVTSTIKHPQHYAHIYATGYTDWLQ